MDGDGTFVRVFHGDVLFAGDEGALVVMELDHVDMTEEADWCWR